jgi:hypothetical protein
MKYAILDANGTHVRETRTIGEGRRGNQSPIIAQRAIARIETGFGVNRNLEQQKALRRQGAQERAAYRATLTAEQQLERLKDRGPSIRERVRLLMELGTTEAVDTVTLILAELRASQKPEVRKLGRELTARYVS